MKNRISYPLAKPRLKVGIVFFYKNFNCFLRLGNNTYNIQLKSGHLFITKLGENTILKFQVQRDQGKIFTLFSL